MNLNAFEKSFAQSEEITKLYEAAKKLRGKSGTIRLEGLQGSASAIAAHCLYTKLVAEDSQRCFVAILDCYDDAAYFYQDFTKLSEKTALANRVAFFPAETKRKGNKYVSDDDNMIMRTEVLGRLVHKDFPMAIITYPEAVAKKVPSASEVSERSFSIQENSTLDITETEKKLLTWGFKPVDYVYAPGEFAVRGSIIDIFSYSCPYPIRIDLFGDDVDSIRTFDVATQLSVERQEKVIISPQASGVQNLVSQTSLLPETTTFLVENISVIVQKISDYKNTLGDIDESEYVCSDAVLGIPS